MASSCEGAGVSEVDRPREPILGSALSWAKRALAAGFTLALPPFAFGLARGLAAKAFRGFGGG